MNHNKPIRDTAERIVMKAGIKLATTGLFKGKGDEVLQPFLNELHTLLVEAHTTQQTAHETMILDEIKREAKHRIERYFKDCYLSLKQQGGVNIHLEEICEIIDDLQTLSNKDVT